MSLGTSTRSTLALLVTAATLAGCASVGGPGSWNAAARARQEAYNERLVAAAEQAEALQGPLEGGWVVTAGRKKLYALELADRSGSVEGAWRDLRRRWSPASTGLVDRTRSEADRISLVLGAARLTLQPADGGETRKAVLQEAGRERAVILKRERYSPKARRATPNTPDRLPS